jgi:hypothetical protein
MNAPECYQQAAKWQKAGSCFFVLNILLSFGLIFLKDTKVEPFFVALLCLLVIGSVLVSIRTRCLINDGNTAQRTAQFADAFGVACEHPVRDGYYNSSLGPGLRRLLATTCESAGLTKEILRKMVTEEFFKVAGFGVAFIAYVSYWKTNSNIVTVAAQTLFSGELAGSVYMMLRYASKARRSYEALIALFRTSANLDDPHAAAIGMSAHVDYECAKEEAAILLDSKIYEKLNPAYTKRWDRLRTEFKIDV